MNDFTKGEWYAALDNYVWCGSKKICEVECRYIVGAQPEEDTNAQLIATAGTTATKLAEQGYDAVKVLELMPLIMYRLEGSCEFRYYADMEIEEVQCTTGQTTKHKAP